MTMHTMTKGMLTASVAALLSFAAMPAPVLAQGMMRAATTATVGAKDITGVVTSPNGPEAGVWVIAETHDLGTRFIRTVVTDDQGRYMMPDLPKANYDIWVRGYGLVDSDKVKSEPGKTLNLNAKVAPSEAAAAHYYPAIYWFSMLKIPDKSMFPGTGPKGNGMATNQKSQNAWLDNIKTNGCVGCHQLGNEATRTIPEAIGKWESSADAWMRRIQSGQASTSMVQTIGRFDTQLALGHFGDWTDRIAKGETPKAKPPRPQGVERNVVVTQWEWGTEKTYLHDEISTDRRKPTVNAYGKVYGAPELSTDEVPVLDPVTNKVSYFKMPVRDPKTPSTKSDQILSPSPYWGEEAIWDSQAVMHNLMFDETGRVWFTSRVRGPNNPAFCKQGSDQESAKLSPVDRAGRHLSVYDPKTEKITLVDTCFGTHHLNFSEDGKDRLWTSSGGAGNVVGWLDTKTFDASGDEQKSQGWTAMILDTNGNGKRDEGYVDGKSAVDPAKDKQVDGSVYGIAIDPTSNAVWGSIRGYPGSIVRIAPGDHPPETALTEIYELPADNTEIANGPGYGPRGIDIDRNGVVWLPLSSGHLGSFDRRKCKAPLNGPKATGKHCPEGWAFHPFPGPQFEGLQASGSAEAAYYTWVDQFNTAGLGDNVPMATGDENDSIIAFANGKMLNLTIPYPMGFYAKGLDGRIDDPNAGWKGRGLWTTLGSRLPFHQEGGTINKPKVVHIQIRANPLEN